MRRYWWMLPLALAAGCKSYKAELDKALADQATVSAEKDSLLNEVLQTSKFVNAVNEELAKARTSLMVKEGTQEQQAANDKAAREAALTRVQALVARLNEAESRLEQSSARARSLGGRNAELLKQIEAYKQSIEELKASAEQQVMALGAVIDSQKVQIAGLNEQLDTAHVQNAALQDTVGQLTTYKNTVYWVAGTEDELLKQGVVAKEGKKFLFFGGKSLQPARTLDPTLFHAIDKTHETEITLPADHKYKVVSRQNLTFADSTTVKDGKVSGALRINSPEDFWAGSKFLIMVED